ncbi:hypothetical protein GGI15_003920 [Coemansia interrupta]|uniref:Uncharacterized protein n=1 Tax=Coemansia interrupta TaxID=1126814 RepID=A0A9W8LFC5_9FUNG|nr:hypothetical protein GGI15_003920 [Coemansia interrupta]
MAAALGTGDDLDGSAGSISDSHSHSSQSLRLSPSLPPGTQHRASANVDFEDSAREAIDVAVVSLARYTFADPALAALGPSPIEPPIDRQSRLLGIDQPPLASIGVHRISSTTSGIYEDDGLIAEFTEDRCNRQLSQLARRLLLPDSYVEACFDFHQFLDVNAPMLGVESVQRNVFKCLKICARLSKLHGYSIQLMWQVIQHAHRLIECFTPERAHTIDLWHVKMTNRIRLMAITPASDGSAPPRLPTVPPRELLQAQAREKLLPLPEINVAALNDKMFNRAAGVSSAAYYMGNSFAQQRQPEAPLLQGPDAASGDSAIVDGHALAEGQNGSSGGEESGAAEQLASSTRETELAIIQHQLNELEAMPPQSMGPMLRAALNLLVEMRFRLQLGLPRTAVSDLQLRQASSSGSGSDSPTRAITRISGQGTLSSEAFGSAAENESRVIEYVLGQISTSRRRQAEMQAHGQRDALGFGAPLYMLPHHAGMYFPGFGGDAGTGFQRQLLLTQSGQRGARRRRSDSELSTTSANGTGDDSSSSGEDEDEDNEEEEADGSEYSRQSNHRQRSLNHVHRRVRRQ